MNTDETLKKLTNMDLEKGDIEKKVYELANWSPLKKKNPLELSDKQLDETKVEDRGLSEQEQEEAKKCPKCGTDLTEEGNMKLIEGKSRVIKLGPSNTRRLRPVSMKCNHCGEDFGMVAMNPVKKHRARVSGKLEQRRKDKRRRQKQARKANRR